MKAYQQFLNNLTTTVDRPAGRVEHVALSKGSGSGVVAASFRMAVALLWPILLAVTAPVLVFAAELSHQNPPAVAAGQMASPDGKLEAAMNYAAWFINEDTRADQAFFNRDVRFPNWKDQPIYDCSMRAIIRAIQLVQPYFEDKSQKVVVVPILAELLVLDVTGHIEGPPNRSMRDHGGDGCTFEYERYSFLTSRFEKVPGFRTHSLTKEFLAWGGDLEAYPYDDWRYLVAPDIDKRYVRFNFRISVARDAPYQLEPQFPRHFLANVALSKLQRAIESTTAALAKGISDRDEKASGDILKQDLERMEKQNFEYRWMIFRIQDSLYQLRNTPSFSEIKR